MLTLKLIFQKIVYNYYDKLEIHTHALHYYTIYTTGVPCWYNDDKRILDIHPLQNTIQYNELVNDKICEL